jgi:hypothetical protein
LATAVAALVVGLAGAAAVWQPSRAQEGITVLEAPPPEYDFGQRIAFRLLARSTDPINRVELYWRSPGAAATLWGDVRFEPGTQIEAAAEFDLAQFPLPPFVPIDYWWVLEDAAGRSLTSEIGTFHYEDNRFDWQRLSGGALTVHWYAGDQSFGQAALNVATNVLPRIDRDIRAPLPEHVDVYIYAQGSDIRAALQRVGRSWADGHADPRLGVILVVVAADLRSDFSLQREIPHEMTHVLIYRAVGDNYASVPVWLNEGLAVMNQGQRDTQYPALLAAARDSRALLDLSSLCGTLPAQSEAAGLAYAQSESVVRYLRERFGSEGLHRLLLAYGTGASCDAGLQASLGLGLAELQADWLREVIYAGDNPGSGARATSWLLVAGLVVLAPIAILLIVLLGGRRPHGAHADSRMV